jgi:hypothetical protein
MGRAYLAWLWLDRAPGQIEVAFAVGIGVGTGIGRVLTSIPRSVGQ